jgi:hypothetical protein
LPVQGGFLAQWGAVIKAGDVSFATIDPVNVSLIDLNSVVLEECGKISYYRFDGEGRGVICFDYHDARVFCGLGRAFFPWCVDVSCSDGAVEFSYDGTSYVVNGVSFRKGVHYVFVM